MDNFNLFKEFSTTCTKYGMERFIQFVNMVGWYEGFDGLCFNDSDIVKTAVRFALCKEVSVKEFLEKNNMWRVSE